MHVFGFMSSSCDCAVVSTQTHKAMLIYLQFKPKMSCRGPGTHPLAVTPKCSFVAKRNADCTVLTARLHATMHATLPARLVAFALYQDMIQQLLNSLRLFSFTTRPEPPKDKK